MLGDKTVGDKTVGDKMVGGKTLGDKMLPTLSIWAVLTRGIYPCLVCNSL